MEELVKKMIKRGVLKSPHIISAFLKCDRVLFIPENLRQRAYEDIPLPIGEDQTISQPSTVAFMLELLEVTEGDNVLDIGSGSGWTTALLCNIVGDNGSVIGLERIDKLVKYGQQNLRKLFDKDNCVIQKAKKSSIGLKDKSFDKILVSASASKLPKELLRQLNDDGVLVIPIGNSIFKYKKLNSNTFKTEEYPGFVFVPLITKEN